MLYKILFYKTRLDNLNSLFLEVLFGIFFAFGLGESFGSFSGEEVGPVSVEFEFGEDTL